MFYSWLNPLSTQIFSYISIREENDKGTESNTGSFNFFCPSLSIKFKDKVAHTKIADAKKF